MTIGTLVRAAGAGVETVRYYQRRGLLHEPERPYSGIRRYGENDLRRLRFIRHARNLTFSLDDGVECAEAQRIAGEKLDRIAQQIEHFECISNTLQALLEQCRDRNTARCPMIAALEAATSCP